MSAGATPQAADGELAVCVVGARWRTPWDGEGPHCLPAEDVGEAVRRAMLDGDVVRVTPRGEATGGRAARLIDAVAGHAIACGKELTLAHQLVPDDRLGLYVGNGGLRANWQDLWTPMQQQQRDAAESWQRGLGRMHPLWMLRFLSNNAHGMLAAEIGSRGEGVVCSGPLGGAEALMAAQAALLDEVIDLAMVVCYDARSAPEVELDRRRSGDARLGVDLAVALLLAPAAAHPRAPRFSILTERSDATEWSDANATPASADSLSGRFTGLDTGAVAPALPLALAAAGKQLAASTAATPAEHCYSSSMGIGARLRIAPPPREQR